MPARPDIRVPLRDRDPFLHVRRGMLDVEDGAVVVADVNGIRTQVPVGALACLMLEPGTSITHAAVKACAEQDCLLLWTVRVVSGCIQPALREVREATSSSRS